MSKTEHSPLPWQMAEVTHRIYTVANVGVEPVALAHTETDGQFIVTACNSYYHNQQAIAEMVEALGALLDCPVVSEMDTDLAWGCIDSITARDNASALIAKHKAKP